MSPSVGTRVRSRRRQRGLAFVELAITAPLLALLLVASAEIGRVAYQYNTLSKAVRDGVRYASAEVLQGSTGTLSLDAQLVEATQNLVVYGNRAGTGDSLLPGFAADDVIVEADGTEHIRVRADYDFQPILGPRIGAFFGGQGIALPLTLSNGVTMRAL